MNYRDLEFRIPSGGWIPVDVCISDWLSDRQKKILDRGGEVTIDAGLVVRRIDWYGISSVFTVLQRMLTK